MMPKPPCQRLGRPRRMTIAAGYVCESGIVLCADTQETVIGYTKTDTDKLIAFQCPAINLIFAGAGNAVQIEETEHEIAAAVIEKAPSGPGELRDVIRGILQKLFSKEHYPKASGPEVDLLMAIQYKDNAELLRIADCSIAPVRKTAAVGSGIVLALQLLQRHYDRNVQVSEAAIICIYVLHHVKKWVDGCGGNTEVALIPKTTGTTAFMPSSEVEKFERYSRAYDDALKGLLLAVPRTPKNLQLFDHYIESAKNELKIARTAFQEYEDTMREMAARLGMNYEEMMQQSEAAADAFLREGVKPST
jgi:hypothetical protein